MNQIPFSKMQTWTMVCLEKQFTPTSTDQRLSQFIFSQEQYCLKKLLVKETNKMKNTKTHFFLDT